MARKKRSTSPTKGPAVVAKPPPEPVFVVPDTLEGVMEAFTILCDRVDKLMAHPRRDGFTLTNPSYQSPLRILREKQYEPLLAKLDELLNPTRPEAPAIEYAPTDETSYQDPTDYLRVVFHVEWGQIPSWSRCGSFVLWLGPFPVRCTWSGMFSSDCFMEAVDPRGLWFDDNATVEGFGYVSPADTDVAGFFRRILASRAERHVVRRGNKEAIRPLNHLPSEQAQAVANYLAGHRWLQEALRTGPVNPIPMPRDVLLTQPSLLG